MSKKKYLYLGKDFHYEGNEKNTIMLHDEQQTELRHCQTDKHLYCSAEGAFWMRYGVRIG